jgi:hypothetical protein
MSRRGAEDERHSCQSGHLSNDHLSLLWAGGEERSLRPSDEPTLLPNGAFV